MYSAPKLTKFITSLPFIYKAMKWVPTALCSSGFITYAPSFISGKLFLE